MSGNLVRLRMVLAAAASIMMLAAAPASALNVSGRVITKKMLADCKQQAREQKLSFFKRRKFVRNCVRQ